MRRKPKGYPRSALDHVVTAAERATQDALKAERRKPTEADAPPLSTFPGKAPVVHPEQLTLE